jgi:glyoxylase-like metal-dependent hydrolase (beta-lactamase superfamily II)
MIVYPLLTPVSIKGESHRFNFFTAETVLQTQRDLIIFDTGFPNGHELAAALRGFSLDPLDFTLVFHTHMHIDHCGGDRLFRNARIVLSREESRFQKQWREGFNMAEDRAGFVLNSFPNLSKQEAGVMSDMLSAIKKIYWDDRNMEDRQRITYVVKTAENNRLHENSAL